MSSELIKIRPDLISGIVVDELYVDDFIVSDGWAIHSFNYNPPKGEETHVSMEIYLRNSDGKIVIEKIEFDFQISNVKKVLSVLSDPLAFSLPEELLNTYPPQNIDKNDIIKKYSFTNILKINYVVPGETVSSTEATVEFEIGDVTYSSKLPILFKETWSENKFNNLVNEDINVKIWIENYSLKISEASFKFETNSLKIKSAKILKITTNHTFDVEIIVQGFVRTKRIRKIVALDAMNLESVESIFEETIDFKTDLPGEIRLVTADMIINNVLDEWIDIKSINWINHEDLETTTGQYLIKFSLGSSFVEKTFVINFEESQAEYWTGKINASSIQFDPKYAIQPESSFPIESTMFVNNIKMTDYVLAQFSIDDVTISSTPGINQRLAKYNVGIRVGNNKKIIEIEVEFQKTILENTIFKLNNTREFLEHVPAELHDFGVLEKTLPLFKENIKEIKILNFSNVLEKTNVKQFNNYIKFNITNIWIQKFNNIDSMLEYKFEISVKGMREKIYKTIFWNNSLTEKQNSLKILNSITGHDIQIVDPYLLQGKPLPFYSTNLFIIKKPVKIFMIELIGHEEDDSRKINLQFTIEKDEKTRVIKKQLSFTHFLSDINARQMDDEYGIEIESPEIESPSQKNEKDDQLVIDLISAEMIQVFLDLSGEPLKEISSTSIFGIPDGVERKIEYDFPKPGNNSAAATIIVSKNYATKRIPMILEFAKPMSKKTYRIYKKAGKKGGE